MMTKGKYWVGDLCYVLDNDWDEVCGLLFTKQEGKDSKMNKGEFQLDNGVKFALYGTAWGDGGYLDQIGNVYGVDAGVIGCVKVDDLYKIGESPASGGHIHTFEKDFETGYDEGTIYFGDLRIETDPKSDEDEEDDECSSCGNPTYSLACRCDGWDTEDENE
jgi:hypothetical protein